MTRRVRDARRRVSIILCPSSHRKPGRRRLPWPRTTLPCSRQERASTAAGHTSRRRRGHRRCDLAGSIRLSPRSIPERHSGRFGCCRRDRSEPTPADLERRRFAARVQAQATLRSGQGAPPRGPCVLASSSAGLLRVAQHFGDLVELGVYFVGQLFELTPGPAKFRRLVRGAQQVTAFPLNVVYDAAAIETAMQADRNESRLTLHEASTLRHQRQCFGLLVRFSLDNRDLRDRLVDLGLWHGDLLCQCYRPISPNMMSSEPMIAAVGWGAKPTAKLRRSASPPWRTDGYGAGEERRLILMVPKPSRPQIVTRSAPNVQCQARDDMACSVLSGRGFGKPGSFPKAIRRHGQTA